MMAADLGLIEKSRQAYMIGIGGVGMSSLARVLKYSGLEVCGSDIKESRITHQLESEGIPVFLGQQKIQFGNSDLVIYSSAIGDQHFELKKARELGLRVYHRAEVLSSILNEAETSVAVTGTHGKTTTASFISYILSELKKDPTCLVGGDLLNLGTNAILGDKSLWVAEVDESDKTHELFHPNYLLLTNLEEDHVENYRGIEDLEESFSKCIQNMTNPGVVIYSTDDETLERLVRCSGKPSISFGLTAKADFSAQNIELCAFGCEFDLMEAGFFTARFKLNVPGIHNVKNALGAIALLAQLGVDLDQIMEPLSTFRGARRRMEIKWKSRDLVVVDDYAHHPTEAKACINALQRMGGKVTVVFQPHRFSRTYHFHREFAEAFKDVDELILTEVFGAGEENALSVGSEMIYEQTKMVSKNCVRLMAKSDVCNYLFQKKPLAGTIAFLGAGDIGEIAYEFVNRVKTFIASKS